LCQTLIYGAGLTFFGVVFRLYSNGIQVEWLQAAASGLATQLESNAGGEPLSFIEETSLVI
jgi:hypothetical protein